MSWKALFQRKKSKKKTTPTSVPPSQRGSRTPSILLSSTLSTKQKTNINELEQVFKKFDVNGDGKISSSELGSILSSLGHHSSEEELKKMITEFDADGDGFIDFQEFVHLNGSDDNEERLMENIRDAFNVYDIDGNGSISAEELHKVMESIGEECSVAECRRMINGVDCDGNGMIDFEEFKVMMMMGASQVGLIPSSESSN